MTSNQTRELEWYGVSRETLHHRLDLALDRGALICATLCSAQDAMTGGQLETARRLINQAKFFATA